MLRPDAEVDDIALILEQLAAVRVADAARTGQLRRRYLTLVLDALHAGTTPLPGSPPTWAGDQAALGALSAASFSAPARLVVTL